MNRSLSNITKELASALAGTPRDWRLERPALPSPPRPGTHWIGPIVAVGTTTAGWWAFKDAVGKDDPVAFALFIGSVSILLMAWSNILSTRARILEATFGGLDRMYRWHRWFGVLSIGAMWLHTQTIDDVKGIRGASKNIADAAEDLAGTATNILYALVAISLLRWIPTRWWRLTHKLLVIPYAFACWHFYTATKPYANDSGWGRWFTGFMVLGLVAWFVQVVWHDMVRRGRRYRVSRVDQRNDTVTVELEPIGTPLRHKAGQFAFVKVDARGLREPHPFTIASAPDEPVLRFVIKDLGDWTSRIGTQLRVGTRVLVDGPYGHLHPRPKHPREPVVWIAGGVGITPFLGAARTSTITGSPVPHLFYCVRSRDSAPGLPELEEAHRDGRIVLHLHASAEGERLQPDDLERVFGAHGLRNAHVVMCGPMSLIKAMRPAVRSLGARHVEVEGFDIRTGVGPDLSREIDRLLRSRRVTV